MENDIKTERHLHRLICGETDPKQTRRLLRLVAEDETALSLLRKMLLCRQASRKAFGLDRRPSLSTAHGPRPTGAGATAPPGGGVCEAAV